MASARIPPEGEASARNILMKRVMEAERRRNAGNSASAVNAFNRKQSLLAHQFEDELSDMARKFSAKHQVDAEEEADERARRELESTETAPQPRQRAEDTRDWRLNQGDGYARYYLAKKAAAATREDQLRRGGVQATADFNRSQDELESRFRGELQSAAQRLPNTSGSKARAGPSPPKGASGDDGSALRDELLAAARRTWGQRKPAAALPEMRTGIQLGRVLGDSAAPAHIKAELPVDKPAEPYATPPPTYRVLFPQPGSQPRPELPPVHSEETPMQARRPLAAHAPASISSPLPSRALPDTSRSQTRPGGGRTSPPHKGEAAAAEDDESELDALLQSVSTADLELLVREINSSSASTKSPPSSTSAGLPSAAILSPAGTMSPAAVISDRQAFVQAPPPSPASTIAQSSPYVTPRPTPQGTPISSQYSAAPWTISSTGKPPSPYVASQQRSPQSASPITPPTASPPQSASAPTARTSPLRTPPQPGTPPATASKQSPPTGLRFERGLAPINGAPHGESGSHGFGLSHLQAVPPPNAIPVQFVSLQRPSPTVRTPPRPGMGMGPPTSGIGPSSSPLGGMGALSSSEHHDMAAHMQQKRAMMGMPGTSSPPVSERTRSPQSQPQPLVVHMVSSSPLTTPGNNPPSSATSPFLNPAPTPHRDNPAPSPMHSIPPSSPAAVRMMTPASPATPRDYLTGRDRSVSLPPHLFGSMTPAATPSSPLSVASSGPEATESAPTSSIASAAASPQRPPRLDRLQAIAAALDTERAQLEERRRAREERRAAFRREMDRDMERGPDLSK